MLWHRLFRFETGIPFYPRRFADAPRGMPLPLTLQRVPPLLQLSPKVSLTLRHGADAPPPLRGSKDPCLSEIGSDVPEVFENEIKIGESV